MITVIGGDFKRNGIVKLVKRKGAIETLTMPTGFMKTQLYVPANIKSVTQQGNAGLRTLLQLEFTNGKAALLSMNAREAQYFISMSFETEQRRIRAAETSSSTGPIANKEGHASESGSFLGNLFFMIFALGILPFLFCVMGYFFGYGLIAVGVAGLIAYVISFSKPLSIPFGKTSWKSGLMAISMVLGIGLAFIVAKERTDLQVEMAELKKTDPAAYLAKTKQNYGEWAWLEALKEIDPKTYEKEKALFDQRKAKEEEVERLTKEKEAKEAARKEACGHDSEAIAWADSAVRENLKNPDSADFPWLDGRAIKLECGRWKVTSYVDATNGFGATIRTNFTAIMRKVSRENWVLEDLRMW